MSSIGGITQQTGMMDEQLWNAKVDRASRLDARNQAALAWEVDKFNKEQFGSKPPVKDLGKDEFLTLLLTQLSHQDPTAPMEDREFISQMAQLTTVQQMTSMANDFARLKEILSGMEATTGAAAALGKGVEITQGDQVIQGTVLAMERDVMPRVLVNGEYYSWDQVTKVFER